MGLGPSIKMTTLHHYNCPVTRQLLQDSDIDFVGVFIDGVSEGCDDKLRTATLTAELCDKWNLDGAIVAIDGWGNHHVDFVSVIGELGNRNIPSVGLSYIGLQGRLVCTNEYVDTIVDFNKEASGYETCVVGENNPTQYDAYKAVALLKNKVRKSFRYQTYGPKTSSEIDTIPSGSLTRKYIAIHDVILNEADSVRLQNGALTIPAGFFNTLVAKEPRIKEIKMQVVRPGKHDFFVNSNLDYEAISCKSSHTTKDSSRKYALGTGDTFQLDNLKVMLSGVEDASGYQPANIGSSEGILSKQVVLDMDGTPASDDLILHLDFIFEEGEGRTAEGIEAAHILADTLMNEIRKTMSSQPVSTEETYQYIRRPGKMRIGLVKIISGLGNMYDSSVNPAEPCGIIGAESMRMRNNIPLYLTPLEILDGAIHSLL